MTDSARLHVPLVAGTLTLFAASIDGTEGADTLTGTDADDVLSGFDGNDTLNGGAGNDELIGGNGNDSLDGGVGADTMRGGSGSDAYLVRDAGDLVIETDADRTTGGYDSVLLYTLNYRLPENVEFLQVATSSLNGPAITVTGNALDNMLVLGRSLNIVDGGAGTDTASYAALFNGSLDTKGATVDLSITTSQEVGRSSLLGSVFIANHTLINIENLWGSNNSDTLAGNNNANEFAGFRGDDSVDGRGGVDTFYAVGARADFTVTRTGNNIVVQDNVASRYGTDSLTNIERVRFSDNVLAFDVEGNAGKVAKVLGAVLGKDTLSNKAFVGIGLHYLDNGMSYEALVQAAIEALLGANASQRAVVDLLFFNIAGVAPSDEVAQPYVDLLSSKTHTAATLGVLAADSEFNQVNIGLTGMVQTGLSFTPYVL